VALPTRENVTVRESHLRTGPTGKQRCHIISRSMCEVVHTCLSRAANAEPEKGRELGATDLCSNPRAPPIPLGGPEPQSPGLIAGALFCVICRDFDRHVR
jgi:hypothetical protein